MRVLYQDLAKGSGAQASYKMLLHAMATEFPNDQYIIVCAKDSLLWSLSTLANIQVIRFGHGILAEWRRFCLEVFGIGRIARKHEADVIWTSNVGPYVRTGVPQVLMVLNPFQVHPWTVACYHPRSRLTLAALRLFFRRSLRCCDAVQVEMPFMGEYVRLISGAPRWIAAIPKSVESSQDCEQQPLPMEIRQQYDGGLGRSAFTFLFVATCSPHKNQTTVVAAMEILRSRGVKARLALSATEEQLRRHCNPDQVSSLIGSGHILPLGWVDKNELLAVYNASDACVLPSHLEQLSSAHLEAMHWSKPQVSADLPYARDICGDATLYADPDDPADWAVKMLMLMENPELRDRLVAAGIGRMKAFPRSWQEVARRERDFLASVVGRHRKPKANSRSNV
jgi:glycosyltransferase involved in cell wall biosynthesis